MKKEIKKVPYEEYLDFASKYWSNPGSLRFGQAFLNTFFPEVKDPELFHKENASDCIVIIYNKYLDFGKE